VNRRTSSVMQFTVGLVIAIVGALMIFCQEYCFLRLDLEFWPIVLAIFGLSLIATSRVRLLHA
jgi:intracellular septation protein A